MRVLIVLTIWFFFNLFAFEAIKTASVGLPETWVDIIYSSYWLSDIILLGLIIFFGARGYFAKGPNKKMNWLMALVMLSIIPKLFISVFLIAEDIYRFIFSVITIGSREEFLIGRSVFFDRVILLLSLIPFFGIIHGVWKGKYAYKVTKVKLKFKNLPDAFNGFKIIQLSDIHSGSLDNRDAVELGV